MTVQQTVSMISLVGRAEAVSSHGRLAGSELVACVNHHLKTAQPEVSRAI